MICLTFPKLYITAYSNSIQLVPLHPIMISILFHHYKELKEYIKQVEQIGTNIDGLQKANPQQQRLFDF
jgi:hypothetical protein